MKNFFGDGALKNLELAEQLKQCEDYAARGYKSSVAKYNNIAEILNDEMNRLQNADGNVNTWRRYLLCTNMKSKIYTKKLKELLSKTEFMIDSIQIEH